MMWVGWVTLVLSGNATFSVLIYTGCWVKRGVMPRILDATVYETRILSLSKCKTGCCGLIESLRGRWMSSTPLVTESQCRSNQRRLNTVSDVFLGYAPRNAFESVFPFSFVFFFTP
ncbi:hypothetical protein BDW42DRAFT_168329 [Aspergillus taichungensis]|uniref:Uncharacterized protein n=1 Tax=Aspergillus taichungensis TaxID=482145 RepID=A0A2J5HWA5_9EURO|nr:hypothetical protein BDW42DRAFT_168329 [Aspergillus taichungensis]